MGFTIRISLLLICIICTIASYGTCMADNTSYTNPVVATNSPDPGVVHYNGLYYVVTTSNYDTDKDAYPIRTSTDLVTWTLVGYVFPSYQANKNPQWAVGDMWAPEIHVINSTTFNVYFTARHSNGLLSIGVATSSSITGPYRDIGVPLLQNKTEGVIDCHYFRDQSSGSGYLVWKVDGNAHGQPTPIFGALLRDDGLAIISSPTLLITNDQAWEGALVEGAWITYNDDYGYYYLFYSANGYAGPLYGMGVARSSSPLGPYQKLTASATNGNPIMHTSSRPSSTSWIGPGHCSVIALPSPSTSTSTSSSSSSLSSVIRPRARYAIIYHAWAAGKVGDPWPRALLVDMISWDDTSRWPFIDNGSGRGVPSELPVPIPH